MHQLRQLLRLRVGSSHAPCHKFVPSSTVRDPIILFPLFSTLATRQGTIIPHQLWKHSVGSYPLDISGDNAPTSQVLLTELALLGRCLVVYCWYCGVVEPRVETRKAIEANIKNHV